MRNARGLAAVAAAVVALASVANVQADVIIETLLVRNPGNPGELSGDGAGGVGPDRVCGAVDYVYRIGKFEITAGQYTEFLNAVASDDTYGLYNLAMWTDDQGCGITRGGTPDHATYSVAPDWAYRPVNFVSWGDAARFCNWLRNGQPTGAQDLTTTEDGSYYLDGATTAAELMTVVRKPGATWVIPSEDEWYKAAYHYNDGPTGNYYDYPTSTDAIPDNGNPGGGTGNSANFWDGDYTLGPPYWRTVGGHFASSHSPYETRDQGGNVLEWNETVVNDSYRGSRGGWFLDNYFLLQAASRLYDDPTDESSGQGFRVAEVSHRSVVIQTVTVGNPGNAGELSGEGAGGNGPDRVCGAVDYVFRMGRFEVTAGQYAEFLNAVAATDTYGLYDPNMDNSTHGCQIAQNGSSGNFSYDFSRPTSGSETDWVDRPVNYVDWGDAARFANWMHNGRPTGAQDLTTTEDGSYYLNGATSDAALLAVVREPDATWVIPSEDEWYKAAYHHNDGVTGNYWDYPTSSDSVPGYVNDSGNLSGTGTPFTEGGTDPGNYATYDGDGGIIGIGPPYHRTVVGEWENSDSPYGTSDQGGNVWEWNEAVINGSGRGFRGGSYQTDHSKLHAASRTYTNPALVDYSVGFRLADVSEPPVVIETVSVGNPANPGELSGEGAGGYGQDRICGAVDYVYNIGKFEVTAGQYTEFLNAVAADDTYELYSTDMWDLPYACKIERTGSPGSYSYSIAPEWANRPVNYVSWGDAARFCNWLHNGQPTGAQDFSTTENGSYYLNGATSDAALMAVTRVPDATWVIPSEDEWYKAAYHHGDGATGNYFDYPTSSDTVPSNDLVDPDPGNHATFYDGDYTVGSPYYRTENGAHEYSDSPYNTFDQGGNVYEWTETVISDSYRCLRGGAFYLDDSRMHAAFRQAMHPTNQHFGYGFRVGRAPLCIPPSSPQDDPKCPPEGCESGGCGSKSRYVSFYGANPGMQTAIRVRFVSLPGYEYAEDRTAWVQEPYLVTEASGSSDPGPGPTMWAATLDCEPFYTDWSAYDVVDIFDATIVPNGMYEIQLIRQGDPVVEGCYSDPLTVHLSEPGDVVGSRTAPPPQSPPECDCNFNDITACVDKFKNDPTAPRKARTDLINATISLPKPDQKVDFVDVSCAVECFRGSPCLLPGPPQDDPCP